LSWRCWGSVAVLGLLLGTFGCTTIDERHYYQSVDKEGKPVNFYRLTITGYAQMAKARYMAGYYDERALDLYFDEYLGSTKSSAAHKLFEPSVQPPVDPKAKNPDDSKPDAEPGKAVAVQSTSTDSALKGKAFLMVLSTNAQAVVDQVSALVDSQTFAETLATVANKDSIVAARNAALADPIENRRFGALKATLEKQFNALEATTDDAQAEPIAKAILETIIAAVDKPTLFVSFELARRRFEELVLTVGVAK
jgi:hypothetical protein